ncbi:MAG: TonB-dependent receptor [Woeseiaceae bacterium]|nr:TonB-dependent receptor [Woeseiaceae bacterium]
MILGKKTMRRYSAIASLAVGLGAHAGIVVADDGDDYDEHAVDEIIVEGIPLDRTVRELAQPTAVIGGDELAKRQAASLGETLAHQLGVSSTYFGPVASRPVIRGQYGERIRVLSNALDAMDASALSEDHATSVDNMLAERIEIIRGPATLLYGSGAAGGIVNVVDNRISESALEDPFRGRLVLGTDSATGREAAAGEVAFGTDTVAFHLDFFQRDTDDVEIPGFAESARLRALEEEEEHEEGEEHEEEEEAFGVVENTSSESDGAAAALSFIGENGFFGVSVSQYDTLYGIPGHHHHEEGEEEEEEEEIVRVDLGQTRFDLKGEYRLADAGNLRFNLARNDYEHVELEGDEIGTMFDSEGTDLRIDFQHKPINGFEGAVGLQFKDIDFIAEGEEAFVPPSDTRETSVFLFEEWNPADLWTVQASARVEIVRIDAPSLPGYDDTAGGFSLGALRLLGDNYSVAVNYALTERHPNAAELYSDGAHVAVQRIERGSVAQGLGLFSKELSSNFDVTLRGDNERIEWSVTAFLNDVDDYIVLQPTGLIDVDEDLPIFEYNQTEARLYGLEAEARIELMDSDAGHLHTRLSTDFVYGEDEQTGAYLPRITPLRYGIGLHYQRDGFSAAAEALFHADQEKTANDELPTDSYTLVNAEVSYEFGEPDIFVFVRGANLTDEDARQHASPLKDLVPLPGRSVQLGLRYDF